VKAGKESKMTIIDLIEKLRKTGKEYIIKNTYERMVFCKPNDSAVFNCHYEFMQAFLCGLYSVNYINDYEWKQLNDDLKRIRESFWDMVESSSRLDDSECLWW